MRRRAHRSPQGRRSPPSPCRPGNRRRRKSRRCLPGRNRSTAHCALSICRHTVMRSHESVEFGAGGLQRFGDELCRGPARTPLGGDALRLVESGRIKPRFLGKTGRRHLGACGQPVDRGPDLIVSQHSHCAAPV